MVPISPASNYSNRHLILPSRNYESSCNVPVTVYVTCWIPFFYPFKYRKPDISPAKKKTSSRLLQDLLRRAIAFQSIYMHISGDGNHSCSFQEARGRSIRVYGSIGRLNGSYKLQWFNSSSARVEHNGSAARRKPPSPLPPDDADDDDDDKRANGRWLTALDLGFDAAT